MKLLLQSCLILILWASGEYLSNLLSHLIFIPGNILGMLLLLLALITGVIKESHIKEVAEFLLNNMALWFTPLAVNLMGQQLNLHWLLLVVITLITTPIMMITTSFVTDKVMKLIGGNQHV